MDTQEQQSLVATVAGALERERIEFMLIGAVAMLVRFSATGAELTKLAHFGLR